MTPQPHSPFTLTVDAAAGTATLHLTSDLDYATSDELVRYADQCLTTHHGLLDLRLDCTGLQFCDSMGISALLMIHRRTTARDVRLHLDHPPASLERILSITGVAVLFSQAHIAQQAEQAPVGNRTSPDPSV
ncbi:STAS domain-containing protein [Streptomyces sp. NPDC056500]|uniref:STAS domain-containing protein n=1 Tax=Streptomyces sp. NPDC056500 TaxID=3345840 RepID=UPI0036B97D99